MYSVASSSGATVEHSRAHLTRVHTVLLCGMNVTTFSPLFGTIVLSSLWTEPDHVVKVFITMLACKDGDHVVRMSAYNIAQAAHKTEAEVLDALKILSEPDRKRIEPQEHEGRRIQKVDGGWLILNGQKYQEIMQAVFRRAKNADRMRLRRAKEREQRDAGGTDGPFGK